MKLLLIRHGATPGNLEKRYVGRTDESLTQESLETLGKEAKNPETCRKTCGDHHKPDETLPLRLRKHYFRNMIIRRSRGFGSKIFPSVDFGKFEYKTIWNSQGTWNISILLTRWELRDSRRGEHGNV